MRLRDNLRHSNAIIGRDRNRQFANTGSGRNEEDLSGYAINVVKEGRGGGCLINGENGSTIRASLSLSDPTAKYNDQK